MLRTFALSTVVLLAAPNVALAANYEIDPVHSAATFAIRHMMISTVRGQFSKISGTAAWEKPDFSDARVDVTIDAASVDTRFPKRDADLKSPMFLDVAKFPTLTFKSKKVEKAGGKVKLHGDLTIHGVTKEVVFEVEGPTAETKDPFGNTKVGASATTKINRKDFGLVWNKTLETGGVLVGEEVTIVVDLELTKKAPVKAER
jgi:polyisoprenoid-binding protein YceI